MSQLNCVIKTVAKLENNPSTTEILKLRPDIDEDRDKPYFDTWQYWKNERFKNAPSPENKKKTLLLIGPEAHKYSIAMKASSCWSATDHGHNWKNQRP